MYKSLAGVQGRYVKGQGQAGSIRNRPCPPQATNNMPVLICLLALQAAVQPVFIIPGSEQHVCGACASLCFPPGLLVSQIGGPIKVRRVSIRYLATYIDRLMMDFTWFFHRLSHIHIQPFVCASMELCAGGLGTYLFESRLGEAEAIVGPATVATNAEVRAC